MIICALDFRHVINKYKQTKFPVVVDILLETVWRGSQAVRLWKTAVWKKNRILSLYSRIIAELNNI